MHNFNSPFPRGIESKFPGERGMKIRQIPRGIGDGDPRGGNPNNVLILKLARSKIILLNKVTEYDDA